MVHLGGAYVVLSKVLFTAVGVTGLPALAITAPGTTVKLFNCYGNCISRCIRGNMDAWN